MFNHKDARIKKLHEKGMTVEQIARKLGAPEDLERVREGLARIAGGEKSCAHCGEEIPATRNKRHNKYCDNACQNAERSSKILEAWKSGEDSGTKAGGRLKTVVRNFIFKKFDNECCECGWSEVNPFSGRVALEVDHIDGDSSNNTEENLRLICPNCHALTSTYKSLNKGRASQERLQYSRLK